MDFEISYLSASKSTDSIYFQASITSSKHGKHCNTSGRGAKSDICLTTKIMKNSENDFVRKEKSFDFIFRCLWS